MKIFLVVNNYAGQKCGARAADIVVSYLMKKRCSVEYSYTEYSGHATKLAAEACASGFDLVAAVGGDGTVNEVAQGLAGTKTPMGIIPVGSGNGLARELGISLKLLKSAKNLIIGKDQHLDVCRLNNQRFFCTSGIGFDALIAEKMSKSGSRGFLKYIQIVLKESLFFKPFDVCIKIDGVSVEKPVFLITFANASQFGNNAFIAPEACLTDGLIDVVVVGAFSRIWMPFFAIALFTQTILKLPFVNNYKARQIDIQSADSPYYHFDGESGMLNVPAKITLDAAKIWVRCGG